MRWLGILLVLVLSAGIVAYFAWLAFLFAVDGGLVAALVPLLALISAALLAIVIHELGHLLAGLAGGFRIRQLNILTLSLDLESGAVGFRLAQGADALGYVGFGLADGARPTRRLVRKLAAFVAAGPLANVLTVPLALAAACLLQPAGVMSGPVWLRDSWLYPLLFPGSGWVALCGVVAVVGLWFGVVSLLPDRSRTGPTDGLFLFACWRDAAWGLRYLAVEFARTAMARGVRPRAWDAEWVAHLAGERDGSPEQIAADLFRYYHAEDAGRIDEAGRALDPLLEACGKKEPLRKAVVLETAYFVGFHRGDAEGAGTLFDQLDRQGIEDHTWLRAEAAVRGAEGKHAEALALIESALEAVPRSLDPGGSIAERDWLERMRSHYLDRMASKDRPHENPTMPEPLANFIDRVQHAFHEGDPHAKSKAIESANVARLQEQYRALASGDLGAFAATLTEDIEMEIVGPPELPFSGSWKGRDTVVEAVKRNFAMLEDQRPAVESVVAQGDTVVVLATEEGKFKATGRSYRISWVQWFTFRDGLLCRFRELTDADGLVRAARTA